MLAKLNPFNGDGDIVFYEPTHRYTVKGKRVRISVTALGARAVPAEHKFDGLKIIRSNLNSWRANASNKHHSMVVGVSDDEAISAIFKSWDRTRNLGTGMHKAFEQHLNDETVEKESEFAHEMAHLRASLATMPDMKPVRTEMSVYANDKDGDAAVAGQSDLVMRDGDGAYHIYDFKRTATDLSPNEHSYGKTFLGDLPLNDHHKYSLQLSLYSVMFELQTGHAIKSCKLLQIHPELDEYQLVEATDLQKDARMLLESVDVSF